MTWKKKNYGGEPTSNVGVKRAVFVGRFQPYHYGHIELINQKINQGIPVLIMIRDIAPDTNNPFSPTQAMNMILKYHRSMNHDVQVMIIPDIESINFGRGVGYEVNKYTPTEEIGGISATEIRDSIRTGKVNWRTQVPNVLHDDIFDNIMNYGK